MTYAELIILAISLSFDTFAVAIGGGTALPGIQFIKKARVMAFFAFFQAGCLLTGWLAGSKFASFIESWDHWIAFLILIYLGGKMVWESFKSPDECNGSGMADLLKTKKLVVLSVATSIDAVAVGVSLAFLNIASGKMYVAALITAAVTALAAFVGLTGGQKLGCYIGKRAELLGGAILIIIGIRILIEHLCLAP